MEREYLQTKLPVLERRDAGLDGAWPINRYRAAGAGELVSGPVATLLERGLVETVDVDGRASCRFTAEGRAMMVSLLRGQPANLPMLLPRLYAREGLAHLAHVDGGAE